MKGKKIKYFLAVLLCLFITFSMNVNVYAYDGDDFGQAFSQDKVNEESIADFTKSMDDTVNKNDPNKNSDGSNETIKDSDDSMLKVQNNVEEDLEKTGNSYPIVLVHGLFGTGKTQADGSLYWGGKFDLAAMLNNDGYEVHTATVAPMSSNWDRACELYAYIKGGTVDYGEAHSKKQGHNRYGRTYQGVLPDAGGYDENGELKKVHLIGHSMGGETIRVFAQLLENGNEDEIAATGEETSPLFKGGSHWIDSILTIASPHDGSQFDDVPNSMEPVVHQMIATAAAGAGLEFADVKYDFMFDQWGLKQEQGEKFDHYFNRVFKSNIWKRTNDLGDYDLSLAGARELNSWVKAQEDIYYFSISCVDTHRELFTGHQVPNLNMDPVIRPCAIYIGQYKCNKPGKVHVDSSWWRNDGLVCVRSAMGPHEGSTDKIVQCSDTPERGVWNYLGEINNISHTEITGMKEPIYKWYLRGKYESWCELVTNLD